MKTFVILCALSVLCGSILSAADITLIDGRTLHDATIVSQSSASVTVRHAGGLASVPKAALPADLQAKYPVSVSSVVQSSDSGKAARLAAVRATEQARTAKAAQAERAQQLKEHPQPHEITYRVESRTPATKVTIALPVESPAPASAEADQNDPAKPVVKKVTHAHAPVGTAPTPGLKTFIMQGDSYGVWSQTFIALDGFRLQLGLDSLNHKFAETATLVILVDGAEVRRERLEPRSGDLTLAWNLGAADADQPAVARSGGADSSTPGEWVTTPEGNRSRITHQDPGFKWKDE